MPAVRLKFSALAGISPPLNRTMDILETASNNLFLSVSICG